MVIILCVQLTLFGDTRLIVENFVPEVIPIDGDNPDHIKWLYDRSVERANRFGITGVTVRLTQGKVCLKPYHFIPHNTIVFFHHF